MKPTTGGYFEGVLQVRKGTKELIAWIHARVKADGRAVVVKEKTVPNGVDLYMNDQHYLQNLGRKLQKTFFGTLKISTRMHTVHKMTSKELHRVTVLFEPFAFKRGDIVKLHGETVEILFIGKKAQVKYLDSGQRKLVPLEQLKAVNR